MLFEFDLAGAEWVIVAYLANDAKMIEVAESGKSPHVATGALMSGAPEELIELESQLLGSTTDAETLARVRREQLPQLFELASWIPRSMTIRQAGKKCNHGMNYDMRYKRFALLNEIPENEASTMVDKYHAAYPGIRGTFHEEVRQELRANRCISDLFGNKARLLDEPGPDLWDKAYSFKPQGTVANIVKRAMVGCFEDKRPLFEPMRMLANVHDSLLFEYPSKPWDRALEWIAAVKAHMSPTLQCKGHSFVLGVDCKAGWNWGEMKKISAEAKVEKPTQKADYLPTVADLW